MEYEYLFTKGLHEKLKEKIKGKIFCKVVNDILIVDIDTREGVTFGYTQENFSENLQIGKLDSDKLTVEIVQGYRNVVLNKFFFQEGEHHDRRRT